MPGLVTVGVHIDLMALRPVRLLSAVVRMTMMMMLKYNSRPFCLAAKINVTYSLGPTSASLVIRDLLKVFFLSCYDILY